MEGSETAQLPGPHQCIIGLALTYDPSVSVSGEDQFSLAGYTAVCVSPVFHNRQSSPLQLLPQAGQQPPQAGEISATTPDWKSFSHHLFPGSTTDLIRQLQQQFSVKFQHADPSRPATVNLKFDPRTELSRIAQMTPEDVVLIQK